MNFALHAPNTLRFIFNSEHLNHKTRHKRSEFRNCLITGLPLFYLIYECARLTVLVCIIYSKFTLDYQRSLRSVTNVKIDPGNMCQLEIFYVLERTILLKQCQCKARTYIADFLNVWRRNTDTTPIPSYGCWKTRLINK